MHKNGWRPFWAALGAALLVLLPLVGGTVLLTRQMVRTRIQTAQPQSGVPIQLPRAEHRMTLLLCTAGEQPGFLHPCPPASRMKAVSISTEFSRR